jgi:membrane protein DedA with SNARE-associated domain
VTDAALQWLEQAMGSPWIYLALFALAALDAVLPVVPSETAVVTAGVFAATGHPDLVAVVAVAAAGAVAGDHLSYWAGRRWGAGLLGGGLRRRAALARAGRALGTRGPTVLVVARYVPGGRTATTLVMGAVAYPLRVFSAVDALAGLSWSAYSAGIGYLGGAAFADDPLLGVAVGVGVAVGLGVAVEAASWLRGRRAAATDGSAVAPQLAARQ